MFMVLICHQTEELVAHDRNISEICDIIGADKLFYQDLAVLISAAQEGNANIKRFEDSVFTGNYISGNVDEQYLQELSKSRCDQHKITNSSESNNLVDNLD